MSLSLFRAFINHIMSCVVRYITREDGSPLMASLVSWRDAALAKPAITFPGDEPQSSSDESEPEKVKRTSSETMPKPGSSSWVHWWKLSRSEQEIPTRNTTGAGRPRMQPSHSAPVEPVRVTPTLCVTLQCHHKSVGIPGIDYDRGTSTDLAFRARRVPSASPGGR